MCDFCCLEAKKIRTMEKRGENMGDGICPFDPFGEGRYMYPFENICLVDRIRAMLESEKPRTVRVAFFMRIASTYGDFPACLCRLLAF